LGIEAYFQRLREVIDTCPIINAFNVTYDKRASNEGFIRGEVHFIDGSILHLREFVDVEIDVDRLIYVYQYMSPGKELVFRYDNTGHHKELNLPTYPHHKHERNEKNVRTSSSPDLASVLKEIETLVKLP
jgi:hypothetical protein